jgi:hypothetical protein
MSRGSGSGTSHLVDVNDGFPSAWRTNKEGFMKKGMVISVCVLLMGWGFFLVDHGQGGDDSGRVV